MIYISFSSYYPQLTDEKTETQVGHAPGEWQNQEPGTGLFDSKVHVRLALLY